MSRETNRKNSEEEQCFSEDSLVMKSFASTKMKFHGVASLIVNNFKYGIKTVAHDMFPITFHSDKGFLQLQ